ncbi:hypothetical protein EDB81DRAFT_766824 [Dactylonectria macrodidyma]|uniref:PKD domain-containing protein n=1 Tax=Dactylonectria macrodidyma TaxID=307937 RepID=A0A9P9DHE0_9HYPO|nr:hypothetical protein EDB81DRAFT_766824 [Dactylonectria macrodidyma]
MATPRRAGGFRLLGSLKLSILTLGLLTFGAGAQFVGRVFTSTAPECPPQLPGSSRFVTPNCTDPSFVTAVIDGEVDSIAPIPHRLVSGHFNGTTIKFNIYLPPANQWEGRFFQFVYPLATQDAENETIQFSIESGGYAVQISGMIGFRADAATAKVARLIAAEYYKSGCRHIFGYVYGGSGGSLQTVGAMESSRGVWDGAVPFLQAVPVSYLGNPSTRALAGLVLKGKAAQIADAVRPGGHDPRHHLTTLERDIFTEATKMGIPIGVWEIFASVGNSSVLAQFSGGINGVDPTYVQDFWSAPGYLGTEQSELGDLIRVQVVNQTSRIDQVEKIGDQTIHLTLDKAPTAQPGLQFTLFSAKNSSAGALTGSLNDKILTVQASGNDGVFSSLDKGLNVQIDNLAFIAMHPYYRYQIPKRAGFYGFDQFKDAEGQPIYPQRSVDGSLSAAQATSQSLFTGNIQCKVIAVNNMADYDAFPWHADWYRSQVEQELGARAHDNYRLWYNEHAEHTFTAGFGGALPSGSYAARIVDGSPMIHQALRDLSAWVERGVEPPQNTNYTVVDSQVVVAKDASQRYGVQPIVVLQVNGSDRHKVAVGSPVLFEAFAEVPTDTGKIISMEWDFLGVGDFTAAPLTSAEESVDVMASFVYDKPGTYYPVIKVTAHRDGDKGSIFGRVANLGRCRVVVT